MPMHLSEAAILLPCHSLDDFPVYHEGEDASELLSGWSALWHPALLATTGAAPRWHRADNPPEEMSKSLFVVPQVSEPLMPADWMARAEREARGLIRGGADRVQLLAQLLPHADDTARQVDPALAADFLALGTCYLLVELLTRQMRYMSNFDEMTLGNSAVRAAKAAVAGDQEAARKSLNECFEVLLEARERFYPVDCYLLDLTLVADSTLGSALVEELSCGAAVNLVLSGTTVARMAEQQPDTCVALKGALESGTVGLVGGEATSSDLPLLPLESILWQLRQGATHYERALDRRPRVWGRRRYGPSPALPQLLSRMGFTAALHGALDAGQFPRGEQAKIRWEGIDGSAVDALARVPVDVRQDESFLLFPARMGESMDLDHVATVIMAHWPGDASPFYDDLRRTARYVPVLGRFVTIEDYFQHTDAPGRMTRFEADQYRAPYLKAAVAEGQPDPLSRYARHLTAHLQAAAIQAMDTWTTTLRGATRDSQTWTELAEARMPADGPIAEGGSTSELAEALQSSAAALADRIGAPFAQGSGPTGVLAFNRSSAPRTLVLPSPDNEQQFAQGEVPAFGFAWLPFETPAVAKPARRFGRRREPERHLLSNRHVQVRIDAETGGIRSIHGPANYRGNRLTQQLAFRLPTPPSKPGDIWRDPDDVAAYSTMVAESVEDVGLDGPLPTVISRGELIHPDGQRVARFEQQVRLPADSRVVEIDVRLDVEVPPANNPWDTYFAARFAWPDGEAELARSVHWMPRPTTAKRIEAPLFVDVQMGNSHTTILSGGLPLHRRVGSRMLDTLLHVGGETQRQFRLGVAVDVTNPAAAGLELVSPLVTLFDRACPSGGNCSGWLFRVGARNVIATHWEPIVADGEAVGVRLRLLETLGRPGRVTVRCCRPVAAARQTDFQGQTLVELPFEDDAIHVDFATLEWVQLEVRWSD